jgi:hypothetical protein
MYMAAVEAEHRRGKDYLLQVWETGHLMRTYEDRPDEISAAIGKSTFWVYERLRLAGDYTRAQLVALIDQYKIETKAELMSRAYGHIAPAEKTRKAVHIPLTLVQEANYVGFDITAELKHFLSEVKLSELRPILNKYFAEHKAKEQAAAVPFPGFTPAPQYV